MHFLRRFNFNHGLAISLLLHLSLALPFLLTTLHTSDQNRQEMLRMELFGMVSNRQMEERHAGTEAPQQASRTAQQVNNAVFSPSPDKYITTAAESPVQVGKADAPVSETVPAASGTAGGGTVEQKQQSIGSQPDQASILRAYIARVTRRIQANLVYPKVVSGVESTIAFTITSSGNIGANSLRVQTSSGYAELDDSAIRSARDSAPFEKPPMELDVSITVSFDG